MNYHFGAYVRGLPKQGTYPWKHRMKVKALQPEIREEKNEIFFS